MLRPQFSSMRMLAVICVFVALCLPLTLQAAEKPQYQNLTILYTNDIHGHLFPFDYEGIGEMEIEVGGAARRAALIRQLKKDTKNPVIVMDAGDVFTRGPLADQLGAPDIEVMNAVPYDIMTLGNNEFKATSDIKSQKILLDRIKQAKFPIVSANVTYHDTGKTIVPPYKILGCEGLKVGVFGLTAPRVASYEQAKGWDVSDPITTAKSIVAELRDKTDFIIALTHIGFPLDLELAKTVPGIDVIIGGDSHTWLFEPQLVKTEMPAAEDWWVGGVPVCQDGEWGRSVGKLDLKLRLAGNNRYKVMSYTGKLIRVDSSITPAKDIENILSRYTMHYMGIVGKLKDTVSKAEAPAWVAECMRKAAGTQIGIEPRDAIENGLKAGNVNLLHIRRMFPFVNPVVKVTVTGKQLKDFAAEMNSGIAGAQLRDGVLFVDNKAVEDGGEYTLAIEEYYARSSKAFTGLKLEPVGVTTREAIVKYLSSK